MKVRCFAALAFLPIEDVVEGFLDLSEDWDFSPEFISYFEMTYISQARGRRQGRIPPNFPIRSGNVRDRAISQLPRSNNSLEGLHNALQITLTCHHLSIWKSINALKKEVIARKKKK